MHADCAIAALMALLAGRIGTPSETVLLVLPANCLCETAAPEAF